MMIRIVDEIGNKQDHEVGYLPRIGERLIMQYGIGGAPVTTHYLRVKDVAYYMDNPIDIQATILVTEDADTEPWPDRR